MCFFLENDHAPSGNSELKQSNPFLIKSPSSLTRLSPGGQNKQNKTVSLEIKSPSSLTKLPLEGVVVVKNDTLKTGNIDPRNIDPTDQEMFAWHFMGISFGFVGALFSAMKCY